MVPKGFVRIAETLAVTLGKITFLISILGSETALESTMNASRFSGFLGTFCHAILLQLLNLCDRLAQLTYINTDTSRQIEKAQSR